MSSGVRIKEFPVDGRRWRLDWLGAVERGRTEANEPHIQVALSPIDESYLSQADRKLSSNSAVFADQVAYRTVHCGLLPILAVGSIWRNGYLLPESAGELDTFTSLQISPDKIQLIRANHQVNGQSVISPKYYRYSGIGFGSWVLAVEHEGDPYKVLIPAMEVLRFYYATSSLIARHLFFGSLRHNREAILNYEKSGYSADDDLIHLQMRQGFTLEDGWTIGRLAMSEEAYRGAALVHDGMMRENVNRQPVHVQCGFPFVGLTTLNVKKKNIMSLGSRGHSRWRQLAGC